MTQAQINTALNNLINITPTNEPLDAGLDTKGECTAPVIKFYEALGWPIPPMANDSANGWGTNFPTQLAPFVTHQAYQAGVSYPEGTVMMWDSPHIAIVVSSNGSNTVKVYEQNADPNGSRPHLAERIVNNQYHRATYVLVPLVAVYHIVVSGDTLSKIATANKMTLSGLEGLNPVGNFKSHNYDKIYPGEKVRIT